MIPEPLNIEGRFARTVFLVPYSGIQFLDFALNFEEQSRSRLVRVKVDGDRHRLLELQEDEGGVDCIDTDGHKISSASDDIIRINRDKTLQAFAGAWLPLPVLRIDEESSGGTLTFDQGPLNWVCFRYIELPEPDKDGNTHRLVLAIDTSLLNRYALRPYAAPCPEDVPINSEFTLVDHLDQIAWMHDQDWSKSIVENAYDAFLYGQYDERQYLSRKERLVPFDVWAQFVSLLGSIGGCDVIPRLRFVDTISHSAEDEVIKVDLALDMGNSRTCGILAKSTNKQYRTFIVKEKQHFDLNHSLTNSLYGFLKNRNNSYISIYLSQVLSRQASFKQ